MESEDDWVRIAPGPSEAPAAGPPHEVLLLPIHAPPFWGARESKWGPAACLRADTKGVVSDVGLVTSVWDPWAVVVPFVEPGAHSDRDAPRGKGERSPTVKLVGHVM